jgi:hypothetical protein
MICTDKYDLCAILFYFLFLQYIIIIEGSKRRDYIAYLSGWPPCTGGRRGSREKRCNPGRRTALGRGRSDGRPERLAGSSVRPDI